MYGDIDEDREFQNMHNPYYGDDENMISKSSSNRFGKHDPNAIDVITAQTNIYYEWSYTKFYIFGSEDYNHSTNLYFLYLNK